VKPFRAYLRLLLLLASLLLLFALLAELVESGAPLPLDLTVTQFVQQFRAPWFDSLMRFLTAIGVVPWVLILPLIIFIALLLARDWPAALGLLFAQLGSLGDPLIKIIVHRPRPGLAYELGLRVPTDYSFPSGHAAIAMVVYGFLIYLVWLKLRDYKLARALVVALCAIYTLGMGLSRIYLGEHWFSDVLGGYVYGLAWVVLAVIVYQLLRRVWSGVV
jgi:undecaprenyl-diphosphatase